MPNKRRIFADELWAHFVTFTCYRRRNLLDHDQPKRILLGVLNQQLGLQNASCIGFVVPNHVHALVWFPEPAQLSKFMHGWKRKSSFGIRNWYREDAKNYFEEFGAGDKF
jgi:putative transposase